MLKFKRKLKGPPYPLTFFRSEEVKNVLVVSTTAMGDTLLSLPAVKATREVFPHSRLYFLVRDRFLPLVKRLPYVDEFLIYEGRFKNILNLTKRLKALDLDLCLIFHESDLGPTGAAYLAGVPFILRIGLRDKDALPYLSEKVSYDGRKHQIENRLQVIKTLLKKDNYNFSTRMEVPIEKKELDNIRKKLENLGLSSKNLWIGVQIGASRNYTIWPENRVLEFAKLLLQEIPNVQLAFLGGPQEKEKGEDLKRRLNSPRIFNLCGYFSLKDLPAFLKLFTLIITPDTGPMHLAIAVGTPTICLFVPSELKHGGPYQDLERHYIIKKERPCQPCKRKYCPNPWCMNLISPEEVLSAVKSLLKKSLKR